jgi:hypothetical protein
VAPLYTLFSCQVDSQDRVDAAQEQKCSNQTDLHLIVIDPIRPTDLPQRPPLTAMPPATDLMVAVAQQRGTGQPLTPCQQRL